MRGRIADPPSCLKRGLHAQPGFATVMMVATLSCAACRQSPVVLPAFRAERHAQQHRPSDAVVSVDPQSGTYQLKGHGSYGLGCGSLCLPWRSRTGWGARDGELSVTGLGYWSQYFRSTTHDRPLRNGTISSRLIKRFEYRGVGSATGCLAQCRLQSRIERSEKS